MKRIKLFEEFTANKVTCDNCNWSWRIEDGGDDVFLCHKCDHDNTPVLGESYVLQELEDEFNIELDLYDNGKWLELSRIVIPKDQRGQGIGSKVMQRIVDFADKENRKIYLTPSKDFGASSVSRLEKFYKGFGFEKNTYRNETKETMVRLPK
jgi:predicted GNAT family N-acyltransferase